jgi:hypothetical protein
MIVMIAQIAFKEHIGFNIIYPKYGLSGTRAEGFLWLSLLNANLEVIERLNGN